MERLYNILINLITFIKNALANKLSDDFMKKLLCFF